MLGQSNLILVLEISSFTVRLLWERALLATEGRQVAIRRSLLQGPMSGVPRIAGALGNRVSALIYWSTRKIRPKTLRLAA